MKKIAFLSLIILGLNSILIQTILRDDTTIKNIVRIGIMFSIILFMVLKKIKFNRNLILLIDISLILLIIGKNPDQLTYIFIFILIQCLFYVDENEVERICEISAIAPFIMVFIFLILGITHNEVLEFRDRMTFGLGADRIPYFVNLVYGAISTFYIVYFNRKNKRNNMIIIIICILISTYFFVKTDGRGGYIAIIIFFSMCIILPYIYKKRLIRVLFQILPAFFYMMIVILVVYKNNLGMNKFFSYRPMLIGRFFEKISLTDLFTTKSVKNFDTVSIVDNTYIHLLIGGGIVLTFIIIALYMRAMKELLLNGKIVEAAFVISTLFYFSVESIGVRVENTFVILWWYIILYYGLLKKRRRSGEKNG